MTKRFGMGNKKVIKARDLDLWSENVWLAAKGGGIGSYWGNLRSIGEKIMSRKHRLL